METLTFKARAPFTENKNLAGKCFVGNLISDNVKFTDWGVLADRLNLAVRIYDGIKNLDSSEKYEEINTKTKEKKELCFLKKRLQKGRVKKALEGTQRQKHLMVGLRQKNATTFRLIKEGRSYKAIQLIDNKIAALDNLSISKSYTSAQKELDRNIIKIWNMINGLDEKTPLKIDSWNNPG